MAVAVIINPGTEVDPVVAWGAMFAAARGLDLDVVLVSPSGAQALPELDPGLGTKVRELVSDDPYHAVLDDVAQTKPELVLLARQRDGREDDSTKRLVRRLFSALHCDTMMLRAGKLVAKGERHQILVPASGGPHSLTALAWARDLVTAEGEGKIVPLFVEPDTGELAEAVGNKRLGKILKRAGLNPESPTVDPQVVVADDVRAGIAEAAAGGKHDLMLVGASGIGALRSLLFGTIPGRLFKGESPIAVGVVRRATSLGERFRLAAERWLHLRIPQLGRAERISLFENLENNARWSFDFMTLICLSTAIAAIGLMVNSTAVVIGAMLVAPLMTPMIGAGLALVQGNLPMIRSAARAIVYGFFAALLIGILVGYFSINGRLTPEMEARGGPGLPDMMIALLSGIAASYCIARPNLSSALAGVAIAAALVPPIATVGISISLGELGVARGAAILFATNVVAIILGAAGTFYATGIRGSGASGRRPVWVRRTVLGLILCALILIVPLGSVLLTKVAQRVVDTPNERRFYRVSDEVYAAMEQGIAKLGDGYRVEKITAYRSGNQHTLELDVIAREIPEPSLVATLERRASEISGRETRVRLLVRQVVEAEVEPDPERLPGGE